MKELYWITRLDGLNSFFNLGFTTATILAVCAFIAFFIFTVIDWCGELDNDQKKIPGKCARYSAWCAVIAAIFGLFEVLTPTTKEACMIYLGGNVIDYVQGNDQLREMPDKVINLADEYLDQLIEKNKSNHED